MKNPRRLLIEELNEKLDPRHRRMDMAARLRVHVKGPHGEHHPPAPRAIHPSRGQAWFCPIGFGCYLLPRIYGGRWDKILRRFSRPDDLEIAEIGVNPGQLPGILFDEPGINDVLFLGAPRGSKTSGMVIGAALDSLEFPLVNGGLVAPTHPRLAILWDEAMLLLGQLGWIARAVDSKKEIHLHDEVTWKFVSGQPASRSLGPPVQGFSWAWARVDERQNVSEPVFAEILLRGASYGPRYRVKSSATNQDIAPFQRALDEYRTNPTKKLIPVPGHLNSFIADETWETFRRSGNWSEEDYRRIIGAEVIPNEGAIYNAFDGIENVPRILMLGSDITERITLERDGERAYPWIIGHDFGWAMNASVMLRAFQGAGPNERIWVAFDELLTRGLTASEHARQLIVRMRRHWQVDPGQLYVVGDPHVNEADTDESDYAQFRRAGLRTTKAKAGNIDVKHRFSMMNALCRDADGRRRFFIARDVNGVPRCPKLIESFKSYCWAANGKPEQYSKDNKRDPSHTSDACGYGVFPWEKIRGGAPPSSESPDKKSRKWTPGSNWPRLVS